MKILDKKHLLLSVSLIALGVLPTAITAQACSQSRSVQCSGHLGSTQIVGDVHCLNAIPVVNYPSYGTSPDFLGTKPDTVRTCTCPPPPSPPNGGGWVDNEPPYDGRGDTHIRDMPPGDYRSSENNGGSVSNSNSSSMSNNGHYDGSHEGGDTGYTPQNND